MEDGINSHEDALADIPSWLDHLHVTPLQAMSDPEENSSMLNTSYTWTTVSPDEMVIRQRGRKHFPITWSPDIDLKVNSLRPTIQTPPKNTSSNTYPQTRGVTLHFTPRKRLVLDDSKRIPLTPDKIDFSDISTPQKLKLQATKQDSPPIKRMKVDNIMPKEEFKIPIETALKGLSQAQLINLIKTLVTKHSSVIEDIRDNMPRPDMRPLEERLNYLKSNIFNSLPISRLISKTNSAAYSRAATHLAAFRKCLIEQGKTLVESQHWDSVIEYVLLAWSYVRGTPVWDNQPHNAHRNYCFKALTHFCLTALKKGSFAMNSLIHIQDSLQGLVADNDDMQSCLMYIEGQLQVNF